MITVRVSAEPIDSAKIVGSTFHRLHGAQNYFFGAVREQNAGKKVVAVCYDAFEPLAETVLEEIAEEATRKWNLFGKEPMRMVIIHRTGQLEVGEISVGIGVSSPHRDEAYQASRYIIEQIKIRAPIWKKEIYENGETEWLKGHALCQQNHGHH